MPDATVEPHQCGAKLETMGSHHFLYIAETTTRYKSKSMTAFFELERTVQFPEAVSSAGVASSGTESPALVASGASMVAVRNVPLMLLSQKDWR